MPMSSHKSHLISNSKVRKVAFDKKLGIIQNGEDNAYPSYIERLYSVSITAKQSALVYSKFLRGEGFAGDIGSVIVGKHRNKTITLNKLLRSVAQDLAKYKGFFLHANYNLLGEITSLSHIPFKYCRFGQRDSKEYAGKIVVYDNWDQSQGRNIQKSKFRVFDVFNPQLAKYQIDQTGDIAQYKGQIYHMFLDSDYDYPIATIDAAENDVLSEYAMSLFKKTVLENDFITDRQIFRHNEMDEGDLRKLKDNLKGMKGAGGQGAILMLQDSFTEETPEGLIRVDKIESGLKTNLFDSWEQSCSNNIRKEFANIPEILINEVEGKLGNSSGEAYKEAQLYYNRQTQEDRHEIESAFNEILSAFDDTIINLPEGSLKIQEFNIINDQADEPDPVSAEDSGTEVKETAEEKRLRKEAQANLRGSVGGVQAILSIQKSVYDGFTQYSSAIETLVSLYGFSEDKAKAILGDEKTEQ